jgi:translocator protein
MKNTKNNYLSLSCWIFTIVLAGSTIGRFIKSDISGWYSFLNKSPLTPPSYIFGIAWSILYAIIAISGWEIWQSNYFKNLRLLKILYVIQLIFNWGWTPAFFMYHLIETALILLIAITCITSLIIFKAYKNLNLTPILLMPYFGWLLFATYLNLYIWLFN